MKPDGTVVPNAWLTSDAAPAMSYAYCSDTIFSERVARAVEGVDTLYHEATYLEPEREKAHARFHSTAAEAARVAQLAGVRRLVLGHFSKQYTDEDGHLAEARAIFPDTVTAHEGLRIDLL